MKDFAKAVLSIGILCGLAMTSGIARAADVYLFAGQSNMWGTGNEPKDLPPELAAVDENIRILSKDDKAAPGDSVPLQNGVNNNWAKGSWGCEAELMHRLVAVATEKPIYLVKVSAGGTWLAARPNTEQNDWSPDSKNELLDAFVGDITKAKKSLEAAGKQPQFKAFVWMQGESDSNELPAAQAYKTNLEALIARVREAAGNPDLPVYIGRIQRQYTGLYLPTLRANQARIAAEGKNIFMYDTDSFPLHNDKIHYSPAGQIMMGDEIFDLITGAKKATPSVVAPNQSFDVRAYAGEGTVVGQIALTSAGSPAPTFVVDNPAFDIDAETGVLRVKDLSKVDFTSTSEMKVSVSALNGASPSGSGEITIRFDKTEDASHPVKNSFLVADPDAATDAVIASGKYTELHDGTDASHKYVGEKAPAQEVFPGTSRNAMRFDGSIMIGPKSSDFLTAGTDEDVTVAMVVHALPKEGKTDTVWCAVVNKSSVQPGVGVGYDYGTKKFFIAYANSFNGALQIKQAEKTFDQGVSHVLRLRKVGDTVRLYVDGQLAVEDTGRTIRRAILAKDEGAPMGLGGMFPPAPSFVGYIGKIYVVKGVPTTREEAYIDADLAKWAQLPGNTN